MSRKYRKGDEFKRGHFYALCESHNQFKVIGIYGKLLWIEWQGDDEIPSEVEMVVVDPSFLKEVLILK